MTLGYREVHEYQLGVQSLFVHDWAEGADLYKRAGESADVDDLVDHDGPVLLEGEKFRTVEENENDAPIAYHPYGGHMEHWRRGDVLESPAVLLNEVERP